MYVLGQRVKIFTHESDNIRNSTGTVVGVPAANSFSPRYDIDIGGGCTIPVEAECLRAVRDELPTDSEISEVPADIPVGFQSLGRIRDQDGDYSISTFVPAEATVSGLPTERTVQDGVCSAVRSEVERDDPALGGHGLLSVGEQPVNAIRKFPFAVNGTTYLSDSAVLLVSEIRRLAGAVELYCDGYLGKCGDGQVMNLLSNNVFRTSLERQYPFTVYGKTYMSHTPTLSAGAILKLCEAPQGAILFVKDAEVSLTDEQEIVLASIPEGFEWIVPPGTGNPEPRSKVLYMYRVDGVSRTTESKRVWFETILKSVGLPEGLTLYDATGKRYVNGVGELDIDEGPNEFFRLPPRKPLAEGEQKGLFRKFNVSRTDGRDVPGGDKSKAAYFVLDIVHDVKARETFREYMGKVTGDFWFDLNHLYESTMLDHLLHLFEKEGPLQRDTISKSNLWTAFEVLEMQGRAVINSHGLCSLLPESKVPGSITRNVVIAEVMKQAMLTGHSLERIGEAVVEITNRISESPTSEEVSIAIEESALLCKVAVAVIKVLYG